MNLLLDTCTFLWLALPPGRLSDEAKRQLNATANTFYLSDVSIWEITLKYSSGKLPLPDSPRQWLPSRLEFYQVQILPLTQAAIFLSGELPRTHVDPFDRLLAAQAIESGMTLLSPDLPLSLLGAARLW
ncbi:PIN domain nuclease of toxin-antitoxin system [Prosthecobacter fusiformis]|uniref:PIN domain nuclease of toxin-antitoxin system n=1 Tax=Prosthecobacter fusiformis TaxID=48464 RepID=A0A4R7ST58_9BACT|nr:type II toxin-antitoxin system VapC family toxin [Prosthecobacter fusiformis]TDU81889.1 PIN domain nuclease of toxin-antitoxin system [Prosthecobacter fusiformis]